LLRIGALLAIVALPLTAAAPALAEPNISVWDFTCYRGSESTAFSAEAIAQNQSLAGHLLDGTGVVHTVRATVNGQIVFDIPGQSGRPDVWTCAVAQLGPEVVLSVFLSPRR
jgi:hypothetical protein